MAVSGRVRPRLRHSEEQSHARDVAIRSFWSFPRSPGSGSVRDKPRAGRHTRRLLWVPNTKHPHRHRVCPPGLDAIGCRKFALQSQFSLPLVYIDAKHSDAVAGDGSAQVLIATSRFVWHLKMNTRSALQSPVKKSNEDHDAINDIIGRLESRWRLGLTPRDQTWSPSRQPPSDPGKCFGLIKFLHFQGREILPQLLAEFNQNAGHKSSRERLPYLRALLERGERVVRASSRQPSTTPTSNRVAPASPVPHYALRSGGPPVSSFLISERNSSLGRTTTRSPLGSIQPSTPKRNDEKDPTPPPSPSLEASCRRRTKDNPQPSRKRSSEEFEDRANSKCSRGLSGKRKSSEFAVPGLPPTRKDTHDSRSSSRTSGTARSVAVSATSATSTEVSRTDSVFNHYRDNTRSANTSFTTETTVSQSAPHFNSSGTISWDDETTENVLQCLRQDEGLINPLEGLEIEIPEQTDICISPGKPG
ncbi:uncharacterized protein J3D65DRAFT_444928 [Phyllosticta citribraziliensis]|uniref:Uncharacterized protein n=1 Tax=Phyllosticta citribraziliensis TaxID=989973 RepID=A0ABR1LJ10_9PEZI